MSNLHLETKGWLICIDLVLFVEIRGSKIYIVPRTYFNQ